MNSAKGRLIAVICITAISLAGCGMDAETEKENGIVPSYSADAVVAKPTDELEPTSEQRKAVTTNITTTTADNITETSESVKPTATTVNKDSLDNQEVYSKDEMPDSQQPVISEVSQNDTEGLVETTNANTETEYNINEAPTYSDTAMYDENDNEITYTPNTDAVIKAGNGSVSLIGTLQEQMGKQPLYVSEEESQMLINMLNEIELESVESPDPWSIPIGGGYIMEIEGGERYTLLGGRYLKIGDKYYYDVNNKSDALSGKIGSVLYSYYGEP